MPTPKSLRRDQLGRFINDNETIIRFQQLFQATNELLPGDISGLDDRVTALEEATMELEYYIMTRGLG